MTVDPAPDLLSALADGNLTVFQDDELRREELLADVVAAAWGADGEFVQADLFLTKPTVLRRLASIMAGRVPGDVDRLIGREPHSLVLAAAVSLETGLPLVVVRPETSSQDTQLGCHGELHAGERVHVVEGVTGTGSSAAVAVRAVRDRGAAVTGVLAAVDRGHGASELLEGIGVPLGHVFTDAELRYTATRGREKA